MATKNSCSALACWKIKSKSMPQFVKIDVDKIVVLGLFFLRPEGQQIAIFQKGQILKIKQKQWRVGQKSTFAWVAFGQKVVEHQQNSSSMEVAKIIRNKKNRTKIDGKMEVHQKSASETNFWQVLVDSGSILGSKMGAHSEKAVGNF